MQSRNFDELVAMTDEELDNDELVNMGVLLERYAKGLLDDFNGKTPAPENAATLGRLGDAVAIQDWIATEVNRLAEKAREDGATWREIGEVIGMTRQAVWMRYGPGSGA